MAHKWKRAPIAAAVLVSVTAALALASAVLWPPPTNLSATPNASRLASLASDPTTGDLVVVWEDRGVAEWEEILGRRWDRASESWTAVENMSQFDWLDSAPALLFDSLGHGHLLWTRRYSDYLGAPQDGTDLVWRYWEGTGWLPEEVLLHVDSFLPGDYGLVLAETSDAVLLFVVWNGGFRQAEFRNGAWSALTPWDYSLDVSLAQVLIDEAGTWHAAGYGPNNDDLAPWFYDAYYVTYDGANWSEPLNLSYTDGVAQALGMAFDGQGQLHFLWSDPGSIYSPQTLKSAIWERIYDGVAWSPNVEVTEDNADQAINSFSLTSDVSNTLHLAWSEGIMVNNAHADLDIYYRTGDGATWDVEQQVYTPTAESRYPVLAVDTEFASIAWEEGPVLDQDIYISRKDITSPDLCRGITNVSISGATTGTSGTPYTFAAMASPPTATLTITYTWQASEQPPVVSSGGLVNLVNLAWDITGTKSITVTAQNCSATVSATHAITITIPEHTHVYLPFIWK
jgi:hypothetical protein